MRNLNFRSLAESNFHDHELLGRFNHSRKIRFNSLKSVKAQRALIKNSRDSCLAMIFQLITHVKSSFQSSFAAQTFCTTFTFNHSHPWIHSMCRSQSSRASCLTINRHHYERFKAETKEFRGERVNKVAVCRRFRESDE